MTSRAMIVVAAGSGSRFGADKLLTQVAGRPLLAHTVAAVRPLVDTCVLVCRGDQMEAVESLDLGVTLAEGGPTRTSSEMAGLRAAGAHDLIGIHDGARPLVSPGLVERLYQEAARVGGAVPVLRAETLILERRTFRPLDSVGTAQTPQVFRGPELLAAYDTAESEEAVGHDTAEIVALFSSLQVAAVEGELSNIKVTFPDDLDRVADHLRDASGSTPR